MENKFEWKKEYSLVIVLNMIYILSFYYIMISNN